MPNRIPSLGRAINRVRRMGTVREPEPEVLVDTPVDTPSEAPENDGLMHSITLDYPVRCQPRHGWGQPDHPGLVRILSRNRDRYRALLVEFSAYFDRLSEMRVRDQPPEAPTGEASDDAEPRWINDYLPGLDTVALYGMIAHLRPRLYLEVGSGNSTRVVRRAIRDHGLPTRVVSIDPHPRAAIDALCDEVVRQPFEEVDLGVVDQLQAGDVFFLDGSHRVLMNSDVAVAFLEVLPRLRPGVHVHVHDIWLPSDYPAAWADRGYSEQYLLAAQLLGGVSAYEVEFPGFFVGNDPQLSRLLLPLWERPHLAGVQRHGCSFWLKTLEPDTTA